MSETYNGWTNYETWCVNLWMDNERGSQEFFRERAKEIYDEVIPNPGLHPRGDGPVQACRLAEGSP